MRRLVLVCSRSPLAPTRVRYPSRARLFKSRNQATPVARQSYMLEGAGGNIGVSVGADGILIVDDSSRRRR